MPRTVSKLKNNDIDERSAERSIRVEKESWWMTLKHYAMARETRMILGVLLLLFSVIALLAYLSFLFTGTADQSVLSQAYADQVANRHEIRNILGLPGARLARFLIDGSFGFVSILMVLMCGTYALRIMHVLKELIDVYDIDEKDFSISVRAENN